MTTATPSPVSKNATATRPSAMRLRERALSPLLLSPSLIAILIFVYGFIATTLYISLSNWRTLKIDLSIRQPLLATYAEMFAMPRWQADMRNTLVFTVLFLALSVGSGLLLAILLDQNLPAGWLFRNAFLFPYALSFIVTGVAWRWIFNPETGINLLLRAVGLGALQPLWLTDARVVLGVPLALIPVVIAASWQLSGFAMAMYLAGLGTISSEVREAAAMDGATNGQIYRHVIIPMLAPITVSNLIILGHVSLKIFDLIFAMSGVGPGFATDVPGIFVFEQTFKATRYNLGAAASMVMLLLVSVIIVPYLARNLKEL
jgi:glucose/mannose transport system permease protein